MQNELNKKLPASLTAQFPHGVDIAYATIPIIPKLKPLLRDGVQKAFGEALKVIWQSVLAVAIAGFLCSLGIRQLQLHTQIDENWGRADMPVHLSLGRSTSGMELLPNDMRKARTVS